MCLINIVAFGDKITSLVDACRAVDVVCLNFDKDFGFQHSLA